MNNMGFLVVNKPLPFFAFSIISLTSLTPELMALSVKKGRLDVAAIMFARVVLPIPGGPQNIIDGSIPCLISWVKTPFSPIKWR